MSKIYRISLICVMVAAMITLCILLARYEDNEPSPVPESGLDMADSIVRSDDGQSQNTEHILLTTTDNTIVTDAATELVIIEYFPGGISKETHTILPKQLEGLDRDSILLILDNYCQNPDDIDIEKGLYRIEMTEFSSSMITIEKSYHKDSLDYYYLAFMDDYVVVFYEDKTTVLLKTNIHRDQLPGYLREEILHYKLLAGNADLFAFLETYTS